VFKITFCLDLWRRQEAVVRLEADEEEPDRGDEAAAAHHV